MVAPYVVEPSRGSVRRGANREHLLRQNLVGLALASASESLKLGSQILWEISWPSENHGINSGNNLGIYHSLPIPGQSMAKPIRLCCVWWLAYNLQKTTRGLDGFGVKMSHHQLDDAHIAAIAPCVFLPVLRRTTSHLGRGKCLDWPSLAAA
jgi:hypothetical protein